MTLAVRIAASNQERHQAFRLRYNVYVDEKGFRQDHADPATRTIQEPEDEDAALFVALNDDTVVGTLRVQMHPCDFGQYVDLFQMTRYTPYFPKQTSVTTKFAVAPDHRRGPVAFKLITTALRTGFERGVRFDFICCYPEMLRFVTRLGYRQVQDQIIHPEYGVAIPMVLGWDPDHLRAVHSPLLPTLMRSAGAHDRLHDLHRFFQHSKPTHVPNSPTPKIEPTHRRITMPAPEHAPAPETGNAPSPTDLTAQLDTRIVQHVTDVVEQTGLYRMLSDPGTDRRLVVALIRHAMLESFTFAPPIVTSTFKAIGRMPADMPQAMKHACLHILEEVDHGDMALRTFKALGGDEQWARSRRMTPASYAMVAAYDRLIDRENGAVYLGFMYPFECITPILAERVIVLLESHGVTADQREFIDVHAVADLAHKQSMRSLIEKVVEHHPELAEPIAYASELYFSLYPAPIWDAVVKRARAEIER